jgi:ParB family chromosome partitioning protein
MTEPAPTPSTVAVPRDRDERTVRLGDLAVARENLRYREPPDDDIATLAATVRAAGLLQRLTVRPGRGRKEAAWMALDGRRRLLALERLRDAGEIDDDYPVVVVVETDPARQSAAALLTNTAVPVHIADVIAAIGRMIRSRLSLETIATALGHPEVEIRRLAALSALPAVALEALKAGRLTLKQARLLARLPDPAEQAELAEAALAGHGFQDWRILERLNDSQVTTRDRRCALVDADAYSAAGGRTVADLFGELAPVLLDPDLLTRLWTERVRGIAAVFEAEGLAVHVTAGPDPDLDEDLEAVGYVYGGRLPAEAMARYRAERDAFNAHAEAVGTALAEAAPPERVDPAIVEMIRARIAADQTGGGGRAVTALVLRPAPDTGVEVRCYGPAEPATEDEVEAEDMGGETPLPPVYRPPETEAPEPETEGVTHALHAVRTEVATRGLIRALADDPATALTALIARLFTGLVLRGPGTRPDAALALHATGFAPTGGRVIADLDGEVRERLEGRRTAWEASGKTVIAWVHALPHGDRLGLLAELTAISLDLREARTTLIRPRARAEAAELAALCEADIALHWTPDAAFLAAHPKTLLLDMLEAMGATDDRTRSLKKTELVDWVAEQAAARGWAPPALSWAGDGDDGEVEEGGAGTLVVTPAGEAALDAVAA